MPPLAFMTSAQYERLSTISLPTAAYGPERGSMEAILIGSLKPSFVEISIS